MTRITNRFPLEENLDVTGTPLKTFWRGFQVNTESNVERSYTHELDSQGEMDSVEGYVDLISSVESFTNDPVPAKLGFTILRTTETERHIVDVSNTDRREVFRVDFMFKHRSSDTTVFEIFNGYDNNIIRASFGNTSGKFEGFGETHNILEYVRLIANTLDGVQSKNLRLQLFSRNLEFPVTRTRVNMELTFVISVVLNTGPMEKVAEYTLTTVLYYNRKWQAELRLETIA